MPKPSEWLVLKVHISATDPLRDLAAEGLLALGGLSVLERSDSLTTYLEGSKDPESQVLAADNFLTEWIADDCPEISWHLQPNEDWEQKWKRGLRPRKVSDRVVVKPSWTEWAASPGEIVIQIDPQMAFGTGEHATTRACLVFVERWLRDGGRVLDIGSGSGILAIAATLLGASSVIAIEPEEDANINARENLESNGVAQKITLIEAYADGSLLETLGEFELIVANILSGIIKPLLAPCKDALTDHGSLIVSGILQIERTDVVAAAEHAGFEVADEIYEEE